MVGDHIGSYLLAQNPYVFIQLFFLGKDKILVLLSGLLENPQFSRWLSKEISYRWFSSQGSPNPRSFGLVAKAMPLRIWINGCWESWNWRVFIMGHGRTTRFSVLGELENTSFLAEFYDVFDKQRAAVLVPEQCSYSVVQSSIRNPWGETLGGWILPCFFYGQTPFLNQCYWISLNAQLTPKEVQEQANSALICLHFVQTQVKHGQT